MFSPPIFDAIFLHLQTSFQVEQAESWYRVKLVYKDCLMEICRKILFTSSRFLYRGEKCILEDQEVKCILEDQEVIFIWR